MINALKGFLILAILLILAYPILPFRSKAKKFSTFRALRYDAPDNKKNFPFIILTIFVFVVLAILFRLVTSLVELITSISFLKDLFDGIGSQTKYNVTLLISVIVVNFLILYGFVFLKGLVKKGIFDRIWGFTKKAKKKKRKETEEDGETTAEISEGTEEEQSEEGEGEGTPEFLHSEGEYTPEDEKKAKKKNHKVNQRIKGFFCRLFFQDPDYIYARPWVIRVSSVLQTFIYIVEAAYFLLFLGLLLATFYPMPDIFYDILMAIVPNIFLYPFVSLIFLQEICNFLRTESKLIEIEVQTDEEAEEEKKKKEREAKLKKLNAELIRRYAQTHKLRYFEATTPIDLPEYEPTNKTYAQALGFIRQNMKRTSGHVVESYMRGVDALLNGSHVYFGASFYSELGEYLVAYTYIRLLSGERQIFVVSTEKEVENLKRFIGRRLNALSGCSDEASWRIRDAKERLDQADILIATPQDFGADNIVENNPGFFENACNAIFIEADRIMNLDSYLCTIIANRLRNITDREIRFVFLTTHIYQGLVKSLKKFFKTEKEIVECNSADENENATFMLWNCECDSIYEKNGQRLETPEMLIASAAFDAGVDGIRIFSQSPFNAEKVVSMRSHHVEINEMDKDVPEDNYMICVDDRFNLASAIYAYTRFRGQKSSMVHILSKPYLLREYFASTAKKYVNRSAYIKPRVTEHADEEKLMLLDLFCDATLRPEGMPLDDFMDRMRTIISAATPIGETPVYLGHDDEKDETGKVIVPLKREFTCDDMVNYLLDALLGKGYNPLTGDYRRTGAKNFYRLTSSRAERGYRLRETGYIAFLYVEKIFERLLSCNRRVELRLNGSLLGYLDTFPARVCQQYVPGQSIVYQNCEYEIEKLSPDRQCLYLRHENITFKNCLDTAFLRRYTIAAEERSKEQPLEGVLRYTRGTLDHIRITVKNISAEGETYGFYNLMTDSQTLDFKKGAVGNAALDDEVVQRVRRRLVNVPMLSVKLQARNMECTDGMRLILSAVLNEFLRTMFPTAYRCIAVVPVLEQPLEERAFDDEFQKDVAMLYPHLRARVEEGTQKADQNSIELLFINDCEEDVGVLDVLYDGAARIMEELLSNAYSYLAWLQENPTLPEQDHYIYFGNETLPDVFDLDGALKLLENCNRAFIGTERVVPEDTEELEEQRCAFCHAPLEAGRYSRFSVNRRICISCEAETVADLAGIETAERAVRKHCKTKYPQVILPENLKWLQDSLYRLNPGEVFNEFYYKTDVDSRTVYLEKDNPATNVAVSILHNLVFFWQQDRSYWASDRYRIAGYLSAQMYYEELVYLRAVGHDGAADWIREHLEEGVRARLSEIETALQEGQYENSFVFIEEKVKEDITTASAESSAQMLFDPDRVPRFWKRYFYDDPASADRVLVEEDESEDDLIEEELAEDEIADDALADDEVADDETADEGTEDGEGTEEGEEATEEEAADDAEADVDPEESEEDLAAIEEEADASEDNAKKPKKKKKKKKVDLKTRIRRLRGIRTGLEMAPYEKEEGHNPRLKFYNEIVRHAYDYSQEPIEIPDGLNGSDEIHRIFCSVLHDYPEIFWLSGSWSYVGNQFYIKYRFLKPDDTLDLNLIKRYRNELRSNVKFFTKGIGPKTDPYQAFLTIYRRVILATDYDGVGLDNHIDSDRNKEDELRSLHAALVKRKVVCAGYAVAMQFLLQSVGICCAQIVSDTHAWNLVRLGDAMYHVDATWGDRSNTKTGEEDRDKVFYDYCCVTSKENLLGGPVRIPSKKELPENLEEFTAQRYEYFRYHHAYLTRYDEEQLANIFAQGALKKETCIGFRCSDEMVFKKVMSTLQNGRWSVVMEKAREKIAQKNKRLAKKFAQHYGWRARENVRVTYVEFDKK